MENKISAWEQLVNIFSNKKVIIGTLTTFLLLLLFRLGSIIPMPFVSVPEAQQGGILSGNDYLEMMSLLSGGGLGQFSIFAIGISPYITTQIIIQLLSSEIVPPLNRMRKDGERGRKKIELITRLLTLPFAIVQAYAIVAYFSSPDLKDSLVFNLPSLSGGDNIESLAESPFYQFFYVALMTTGTYITLFIADTITKRGIGNGATLVIFAGIVSTLFSDMIVAFSGLANEATGLTTSILIAITSFILYVIFYFILLAVVVFIQGSTRKIPVQQTGQGLIEDPNQLPFLPIKITSAGVIPVIFASSIITIPTTIAQFLDESHPYRVFSDNYLGLTSASGIVIYVLFILFFTFFYSYIQLNPQQISENFRRSGKFIPGVKVGLDTEKHISKILFRINCIGAPTLAIIAIIPYIISIMTDNAVPSNSALGGTGVLIMVSASLDLWQSIKSTSTTTAYVYSKKELENQIANNTVDDNVWELW